MVFSVPGYIGLFSISDKQTGTQKLKEYTDDLIKMGHKTIIGPIDGSTWHKYRLLSKTSDEPVFPLEPNNPLWYNDVYTESGYKPYKRFFSDKFDLFNVQPIQNNDVELRKFRTGDLKIIYELSLEGFKNNFLYSPISFEEFAGLYEPFLPSVKPELIQIAYVGNQPAGFMFSFIAGERLILKSIAVLPEYRNLRIGSLLFNKVIINSLEMGAKSAIAALYIEGNNSGKISKQYNSTRIREYTLYKLEVL